MKKRIIYLDYLRAIAIISVIFNHISSKWAGADISLINKAIVFSYHSFGRVGVPIFLMLSGVLLLNNKHSIKNFIKRRYPRVIIPFLFWMTLLIIFYIATDPSLINSNLWFFVIDKYLSGRWYVWMILGIYLVIPIIASFIKKSKLEGAKYFLIIWLITTALYTLSVIFDFSMYNLDLVVFSGPIGYLILGYYLHNKDFNMDAKKIVRISLIIFLICLFFKAWFFMQDYIDPHLFRYFIFAKKSRLEIDTITILQVASFFVLFKYLGTVKTGVYEKISNFINNQKVTALAISVSQASYGIYLNHYFFNETLSLMKLDYSALNPLIFIPLIVLIVFLCAYGLIMILNKVPVIRDLTGYH